jgi:hypothetical protein
MMHAAAITRRAFSMAAGADFIVGDRHGDPRGAKIDAGGE